METVKTLFTELKALEWRQRQVVNISYEAVLNLQQETQISGNSKISDVYNSRITIQFYQ